MGVSKVVLGEETLVDLTSDSVNEENLLEGATAHGANGEPVKGTVVVPTKISQLENDSGFLNNSSTVNFEQASERINIQSSDSIKIILGKIKKWFADLKTVAFSGSYRDLSDKPAIPTIPTPINNLLTTVPGSALDATQGKVLDDKISAVNNSLGVIYKGAWKVSSVNSGGECTENVVLPKGTYLVGVALPYATSVWSGALKVNNQTVFNVNLNDSSKAYGSYCAPLELTAENNIVSLISQKNSTVSFVEYESSYIWAIKLK